MDDEMRCRWLAKHSNSMKLPEYRIEIDNDNVFLSFTDEDDMQDNEIDDEDRTILYFDEFGYKLLPSLFKAMGIKQANLV